jgi:preprotein translocase subunit YajC
MEEPKFKVGDKVKSKSGMTGIVMVMGLGTYLIEKADGQTQEFVEVDLEAAK